LAAETLLDTDERPAAVDILLELARGPLDMWRGSSDLAKTLFRIGAAEEAVSLLEREVIDTITLKPSTDPSDWDPCRAQAFS